MNRSAKATLAFVFAAVAATVAARPTMAEPDPIELNRLPMVPVEVWYDFTGNGIHDFGDVRIASTYTDIGGEWRFLGLPTNHTNRLIVARLPNANQGIRIGGDLQRFNHLSFAPIDGVPVRLLADTAAPTSYFGLGDDLIDSDPTHCIGDNLCGDYRLDGTVTTHAQGIVMALSGLAASYDGYRGWLWEATIN